MKSWCQWFSTEQALIAAPRRPTGAHFDVARCPCLAPAMTERHDLPWRGRGMHRRAKRVAASWRMAVMATAFAGAIVVVQSASTRAQEAVTTTPEVVHSPSDDALWLARICVHEAGWSSPDDCRAIWRVFERGAHRHRTTPIGFARMYSRSIFDGARSDPRGWITRLDASGNEPEGYPQVVEHGATRRRLRHRHPPWSNYRADWLGVLAESERIVRGEVHARCRPDDWGGAMDAERAARIGLVAVNCGETHNVFYTRPRRMRPSPSRESAQ